MTEWAAVASALLASVGLVFAGRQLMIMNRQAALDHRVARDGVVVSWRPIEAPRVPSADGTATWLYEVEVHNPGRLPVDDIRVHWIFDCEIRRQRSGVLGPQKKVLKLYTPVLAGGGMRKWQRKLVINFAEAEKSLRFTRAELHFVDSEGITRTNYWPRSSQPPAIGR